MLHPFHALFPISKNKDTGILIKVLRFELNGTKLLNINIYKTRMRSTLCYLSWQGSSKRINDAETVHEKHQKGIMVRRLFMHVSQGLACLVVDAHHELPSGFPAEGASSLVLLPASSALAYEVVPAFGVVGPGVLAFGVAASGVVRLDPFCFRS